jgi:hypothetical protein
VVWSRLNPASYGEMGKKCDLPMKSRFFTLTSCLQGS